MARERAVVRLAGAGRRYGRRRALDGVDLEVAPGEILGLVGPNGSGKTTLLKLLAGFLRPSAGEVRVLGLDPFAARARVMERARFAFAPPALFDSLSAEEHLRHLAGMRARSMPRVGASEIGRALEAVGLADRSRDRVRTFSSGMRQRLAVAQALLPVPELLVLDEPTDGLDPLAVHELRAVLQRVREEHGTAIVLSSHLLVEVDRLVDRMLVLAEGRSVFLGTPAELRAGTERLCLRADDARAALRVLRERGLAARLSEDGELELAPGAIALDEASAALRAEGLRLTGYREGADGLEQALLRRLRERGERAP